jgi:PKD repeat protein/photosystem II stability/assembly factor-like uncharacterized protein
MLLKGISLSQIEKDMRHCFRLFAFLSLFFVFAPLRAQHTPLVSLDTADYPYWVEMMEDPSIPVPDVVRAFETYWEGREVTRGSGWKPFRRWEYWQTMRMRPDGSRATSDELVAAWKATASLRSQESSGGNWTILGPVQQPPIVNSGQPNGLGRVNALAFHPSNPDIIYTGASSGGLWKSTDGGQNWAVLTDHLPSLGVSAILVDPGNPQIIYLGTGDRDHSAASGIGVWKSMDAGLSWTASNTTMGNVTVGDLMFALNRTDVIVAATNAGIFRSNDAGLSWQNVQTGNFKDLDQHPADAGIFYASASGKFYRSTDTAQSWQQMQSLPVVSRIVIATTPVAPNFVYALLTNQNSFHSLRRSMDGGLTFTEMSNSPNIMDWSTTGSGTGGQAWYNLALTVSPLNPNEIYAGGINVWKSLDGGLNWTINAHWTGSGGNPAVHADCHWLGYAPSGRLYTGNDGGVYYTDNGGSNWTEISSGLAISQIYKIGQSVTQRDRMMAGYQDNGTTVYNSSGWLTVAGGDGMECAVDPSNPSYTYGSYYYGSIYRLTDDVYNGSIAGNGTNGITEGGAWVTPFVISPHNPNTMFLGMNAVWRSNNIKASSTSSVSWTSHNLNLSGGNCLDMEFSPLDPGLLYVSKYNNTLYRTDDANANQIFFTDLTPYLPHSGQVRSIETHPTDANTVFILQNRKVFKSVDRGLSWTDLTDNLPDVPMSDIIFYRRSQDGLYLGTDIGVFYRDDFTNGWISFSQNLPAAIRVTELEIWYDSLSGNNDIIRAASYGRGVWQSGLYETHPQALFIASDTLIPKGCYVDFTDLSGGIPALWNWEFPGAIPDTSTQMNPQGIFYPNPGLYTVKLSVRNSIGIDSLVRFSYIHVSDTLLPEVDFQVSDVYLCSTNPVAFFEDQSRHCPDAWEWVFSPDSVSFLNGTHASSPNPVVQFNSLGVFSLSLKVGNANGSQTMQYLNLINVGGKLFPYTYDFEVNEMRKDGWLIENPDGDHTWRIWDLGSRGKAAGIQIYGTNTLGFTDRLITPPFRLVGNNAFLRFRHAYAQYQADYSDSLRVYISDDCGTTWTLLESYGEDGSGLFATRPPQTTSFVPYADEDWCDTLGICKEIPLHPWLGKNDLRIAFESYSYLSNNIFIDDVEIAPSAGIPEATEVIRQMEVWPNPAGRFVNLLVPHSGVGLLSVLDMQGRQLMLEEVRMEVNEALRITLPGTSSGLYLIQLEIEGERYQARLTRQ